MSIKKIFVIPVIIGAAVLAVVVGGSNGAYASGGSNSSTTAINAKSPAVDTVQVSKAYTNANGLTAGAMLIKASSSDSSARLLAYRPDGSLIGEVQNGGGGRYGGTVMPYQFYDPITVTIVSSSGGTVTVPTTPFQI